MKKTHALLIAAAVGIAAAFGLVAATRTAHLGTTAAQGSAVSSAQIARRSRALDRMEAALRAQLGQKPPALPALPAAAAAPAPQRVMYVRPAPVIKHVPRPGGHDDEHEREHEAGGEFDD